MAARRRTRSFAIRWRGWSVSGKGIVLLHDIKKSTAKAVPDLLRALKKGGWKLVHIVGKEPAVTLPEFDAWAQRMIERQGEGIAVASLKKAKEPEAPVAMADIANDPAFASAAGGRKGKARDVGLMTVAARGDGKTRGEGKARVTLAALAGRPSLPALVRDAGAGTALPQLAITGDIVAGAALTRADVQLAMLQPPPIESVYGGAAELYETAAILPRPWGDGQARVTLPATLAALANRLPNAALSRPFGAQARQATLPPTLAALANRLSVAALPKPFGAQPKQVTLPPTLAALASRLTLAALPKPFGAQPKQVTLPPTLAALAGRLSVAALPRPFGPQAGQAKLPPTLAALANRLTVAALPIPFGAQQKQIILPPTFAALGKRVTVAALPQPFGPQARQAVLKPMTLAQSKVVRVALRPLPLPGTIGMRITGRVIEPPQKPTVTLASLPLPKLKPLPLPGSIGWKLPAIARALDLPRIKLASLPLPGTIGWKLPAIARALELPKVRLASLPLPGTMALLKPRILPMAGPAVALPQAPLPGTIKVRKKADRASPYSLATTPADLWRRLL